MAGDAIVARQSPGAGRHMEVSSDGEWLSDIHMYTTRSGVINNNVSDSNLGIGIPAGDYYNLWNIDGCPQYILRGASKFLPCMRPQLVRPIADFAWAQGLKAYGCVLTWLRNQGAGVADYENPDTVNAGAFNGFSVQQVDFGDIIGDASKHGFGVSNRAGRWCFISRGFGGMESVDVQALCGPIDTPNKFEFQYRHATKRNDASLTLLVNDQLALVRNFANSTAASVASTMPWPTVQGLDTAWYPQFAVRSPNVGNQASGGAWTLAIRDRFAYAGVDTPGL